MASLNKIMLIGRLVKDPELRFTTNGTATAKFTLAVDRNFKKEGEEPETDFLNIILWRALAENCSKYLSKGSLAMVEGRLQIRSYVNDNDEKKWMTEIVANNVQFLDGKKQETEEEYN